MNASHMTLPKVEGSKHLLHFAFDFKPKTLAIDVANYAFPTFASEIVSECLWLCYTSDLSFNSSCSYFYAARGFLNFIGETHKSNDLSVENDDSKVAQFLHEWEVHLRTTKKVAASQQRRLPNRVLAILRFRRDNQRPVGARLQTRLLSNATFGSRHSGESLPEFSRVELQAICTKAKQELKSTNRRLSAYYLKGSEDRLRAYSPTLQKLIKRAIAGKLTPTDVKFAYDNDPRSIETPVLNLPNPTWIKRNLDNTSIWGNVANSIYAEASLTQIDVVPLFVLAAYYTGLTSGELKTMEWSSYHENEDEISFEVLKTRATKSRKVRLDRKANRTAYRLFSQIASLTRIPRAHAENPQVIRAFWICHEAVRGQRRVQPVDFGRISLKTWIELRDLDVDPPYVFDRLRKTHKSISSKSAPNLERAATDHSKQVYMRHYVSTDFLLQRSAKVVRDAQSLVFDQLVSNGPVVVPPEAQVSDPEGHALPEIQKELAQSSEVDRAVSVGHCLSSKPEAWTQDSRCLQPVIKCLVCTNAIIFEEHLPQVLILQDVLNKLRHSASPEAFLAKYGAALDNISQVLSWFSSESIKVAREKIRSGEEFLVLPLEMRQ